MKKYHSIWLLLARSTAPRLLLLLLLLCGAETALFGLRINGGGTMDNLLDSIHLRLIFSVIFALWTAVLALPGLTPARYTLDRLQVTRGGILICHWIYAALTYVVLAGVQVLTVLALGRWYAAVAACAIPGHMAAGPQVMLLLFYRNPLLHGLLPLGDWPVLLRNLAVLVALGGVCASTALGVRTDRAAIVPTVLLAAILILFFPAPLAQPTPDAILATVALLIALWAAYEALKSEEVAP